MKDADAQTLNLIHRHSKSCGGSTGSSGDTVPTSYSGCCGSKDKPLGLYNAPDDNNNGRNNENDETVINSAILLCNALGYKTGKLTAHGNNNGCPGPCG